LENVVGLLEDGEADRDGALEIEGFVVGILVVEAVGEMSVGNEVGWVVDLTEGEVAFNVLGAPLGEIKIGLMEVGTDDDGLGITILGLKEGLVVVFIEGKGVDGFIVGIEDDVIVGVEDGFIDDGVIVGVDDVFIEGKLVVNTYKFNKYLKII